MSNKAKGLEWLANIAMLFSSIATLVLVFVLVQAKSKAAGHQRGPQVGDILPLGNLNVEHKQHVFIFALQTTCHFCTASAPELRKIVAAVTKSRTATVFSVFPEDTATSQTYLRNLNLEIPSYQMSPARFLISGTPTVIEAAADGKVLAVWSGKLDVERGNEIAANVN